MDIPRFETAPGSSRVTRYFAKELLQGASIEDYGKTKELMEGYATFKISVKPGNSSWQTFRFTSRETADRFVDWITALIQGEHQ